MVNHLTHKPKAMKKKRLLLLRVLIVVLTASFSSIIICAEEVDSSHASVEVKGSIFPPISEELVQHSTEKRSQFTSHKRKNLPRTGEKSSTCMSILGSILIGSVFHILNRKQVVGLLRNILNRRIS